MSGEKFSEALILGMVVKEYDDTPIADSLVTLDYVIAQGQRVQVFTSQDQPVQNPNVKTNARGGFILAFHWDPTALGTTMDMPRYRVIANAPLGYGYKQATRQEGSFTAVVDFKAVASGRIPTFKYPVNTEGVVKDLKIILKACGMEFPKLISLGRPSGDSYALLGAVRIAA
jgi:hypothetical protein